LSGSLGDRTEAAVAAGCDVVLHCNGSMPEMLEVARQAPVLRGAAAQRAEAALAARKPPASLDIAANRTKFLQLMHGIQPAAGSA
jgi:beta-N-acetylhexosaminidase